MGKDAREEEKKQRKRGKSWKVKVWWALNNKNLYGEANEEKGLNGREIWRRRNWNWKSGTNNKMNEENKDHGAYQWRKSDGFVVVVVELGLFFFHFFLPFLLSCSNSISSTFNYHHHYHPTHLPTPVFQSFKTFLSLFFLCLLSTYIIHVDFFFFILMLVMCFGCIVGYSVRQKVDTSIGGMRIAHWKRVESYSAGQRINFKLQLKTHSMCV